MLSQNKDALQTDSWNPSYLDVSTKLRNSIVLCDLAFSSNAQDIYPLTSVKAKVVDASPNYTILIVDNDVFVRQKSDHKLVEQQQMVLISVVTTNKTYSTY